MFSATCCETEQAEASKHQGIGFGLGDGIGERQIVKRERTTQGVALN